MFGIGPLELIVIAVVLLVVIGPKKLPDLMRQAGRTFVHMRRAVTDVRSTIDGVINEAEDEIRHEQRQALKAMMAAPQEDTVAAVDTENAQPPETFEKPDEPKEQELSHESDAQK